MDVRKNQLVKFTPPVGYEDEYPFEKDEVVLFLGEIELMSGHCIVVKKTGQVLWGYHTDNFIPITEEEI